MTEINGGEDCGSIGGGVHGVNAVVEGWDGEIRRGQGFWPPKSKTECNAFRTDPW